MIYQLSLLTILYLNLIIMKFLLASSYMVLIHIFCRVSLLENVELQWTMAWLLLDMVVRMVWIIGLLGTLGVLLGERKVTFAFNVTSPVLKVCVD